MPGPKADPASVHGVQLSLALQTCRSHLLGRGAVFTWRGGRIRSAESADTVEVPTPLTVEVPVPDRPSACPARRFLLKLKPYPSK